MKVDEPKLVMINWIAPPSPNPDWEFVEDLEQPLLSHCVSVGWLVWDSDECKGLTPTLAENELEGDKQLLGLLNIPMGAITNFAVLENEGAFLPLKRSTI